jgi:hypothetical protein
MVRKAGCYRMDATARALQGGDGMNFEPHELPNSCAECNYCFNSSAPDIPIWECGLESHGETEEYAACSVLVDKDGKPFDFRPFWCLLNRGEVTT